VRIALAADHAGFELKQPVAGAASKVVGIRAGICHDCYSAHQAVEHDDINVLCIGAGVVARGTPSHLAPQ